MGQDYHAIIRVDALEDNRAASEIINGQPIAVVKSDGNYVAFIDLCPHAGARLSGGKVRKGRIICPLHGAPFSLETGKCLAPQPYAALRLLSVRVVDGWIEVALP